MEAVRPQLRDDAEQRLEPEAESAGRPRSEIMMDILGQSIAQREWQPFVAEYVAEANVGYTDPKLRCAAIEIAEEALPLDNESLGDAQRRTTGQTWPDESGETWWA
jgi:predicted transcriptional regulator